MNPVSLTMHTAMLVFGYVVYLVAPGWDAGITVICMMTVAVLGAVTVGALRNHDHARHLARTGQASVDQPGGIGTAMRERLLMLDKRVRVVYVQATSIIDRIYAGIAAGGVFVAAALVVLMGWLPFMD